MMRCVIGLWTVLLLCAGTCAQTIEGKKIIGGHGPGLRTTRLAREYIDEMKKVPLDGVIISVGRNDWNRDEANLTRRQWNHWFRPPAVTIDDFTIALDDLANTDFGRLRHNILWCSGTRDFGGPWFDDEYWEKVALNNARVMAEVCRRGNFEAIWFDVEVGGNANVPGGGPLTWKGVPREKLHPFEDYVAKVRQRARELMAAFVSVKPDMKFIISHAYGNVQLVRFERPLRDMSYSLLPAFLDGLLEGCGPHARVIESGEVMYGTLTYAGFRNWRDWDHQAALALSAAPELIKTNYRHAMATWTDFRSDSHGWSETDHDKKHFSPEKLSHALHNAMAASDEYVWTYSWRANWWVCRAHRRVGELWMDPSFAYGEEYNQALARSREPHDLDWRPGRTGETGYPPPSFDADKAFADLPDRYKVVYEFPEGWLFAPEESTNEAAWDWGLNEVILSRKMEEIVGFSPIEIGDYWENQGHPLDGTGIYRARFRVPDQARGKRLSLAIAGVKDKAVLFFIRAGLSDRRIGKVGGDALGLIDITELVDPEGDNILTIRVTSEEGPGGLYGAVKLLAGEGGREGYAQLRGKEQGKWFHWIRDTRLGGTFSLSAEHTVEARIRIPDAPPLTAHLWADQWHIKFSPKGLSFSEKKLALDAWQWHAYRIVSQRQGEQFRQTLFVDGQAKLASRRQVTPADNDKKRQSALGFGVGWGNKNTAPIKMDVDYLRWANCPFTPEDERIALAAVPEAQERKDVSWDNRYEGARMPDAEGWKWWYDNDPRPFTTIVPIGAKEQPLPLDLTRPERLLAIYDWTQDGPARMVPRDYPKLGDEGVQVVVKVEPVPANGQQFAATLKVLSSEESGWGWPAVTITDLARTDWTEYAGVALAVHNPTQSTQQLGLCIRDVDKTEWARLEEIAPGETKVLSARLDQLRTKILPSEVLAVTIWTRHPNAQQTFLVTPIYLVRRQ